MPVAKTSIDLYGALAREVSSRRYRLEKSDVEQLLNYIKQELIISNRSSLINAAYLSCRLFLSSNRVPVYKFEPSSFFISDSDRHMEIPAFDAWYIIILLSEYLSGAITEDIDRLLPYFYGNYVPKNPHPSVFHKALQKIDAGIFECRKIMYSHYSSELDATPKGLSSHDSVAVAHTKQADNHSAAVTEDIERKKGEIIDLARKQAEEERQRIINAANEEAVRIIQRASFEAEQKISTARKRIIEIINNRGQSAIEAEQLQRGFSEVRSALLKANDMIKNLEDTVSESSIKKVSSQLLELFNLIADTKDSTVNLARNNNDQNLKNTAYNMDVFLDMIIKYMSEYGIQSISSMPKDKFLPKYHTIGTGNQQFDPRSASIKVSKRTGFRWGEQVLQKEQVEI